MVKFSKALAHLGATEPGNMEIQNKHAQTLLEDLDGNIHLRKETLLAKC